MYYISLPLCSLPAVDDKRSCANSRTSSGTLYHFLSSMPRQTHKSQNTKLASFFAHLVRGHDQASRRSGYYQEFQVLAMFSVIESYKLACTTTWWCSWTRTRQSRLIDLMMMQRIASSVAIDCVPRIKDKLARAASLFCPQTPSSDFRGETKLHD